MAIFTATYNENKNIVCSKNTHICGVKVLYLNTHFNKITPISLGIFNFLEVIIFVSYLQLLQ